MESVAARTGLWCPDCGAGMAHLEGCPLCIRCGYSPCRDP